MKEVLNGIGYGNIFIDEEMDSIIATSTETLNGLYKCVLAILLKMANDMSEIIKIQPEEIISNYVDESGCNLMSASMDAVLERQYAKEGKVFKKPETITRIKINDLLHKLTLIEEE